jgi:predicted O-methyltransferase YrrM
MNWAEKIDQINSGYMNAAVLLSACKTGVFESLGRGSKTAGEVADQQGLDERATGIVLCALVAAGLVRQEEDRFSTEPGARPYLLSDSPDTLVSIMGHNLSMMHSWVQLAEVMRTGRPARGQERTEDELSDFILGMENVSRKSSLEVAAKVDLSNVLRLLDLGGGPGTAAITFAKAYPQIKAVVYDLAGPVEIAKDQIKKAGLQERVTAVAGDFYSESPPSGFDLVYISNIIHMMGPDETLDLFRKSYASLEPGGRVIVKDFFLEDGLTEPAPAARFSVNMLVNTSAGKSYARAEVMSLLTEAGFADFEITDIARASQLIVGKRTS